MSKRQSQWKVLDKDKNIKQQKNLLKKSKAVDQMFMNPSQQFTLLEQKEKIDYPFSKHPRESMSKFSEKFSSLCLIEKFEQLQRQDRDSSLKIADQHYLLMHSLILLQELEKKFLQEKNKILDLLREQYSTIHNTKNEIIRKLSKIQRATDKIDVKLQQSQLIDEQTHTNLAISSELFDSYPQKSQKKGLSIYISSENQFQLQQNCPQPQNPQSSFQKKSLSDIQSSKQKSFDKELLNSEQKKTNRFRLKKRGRLDLNQEQI